MSDIFGYTFDQIKDLQQGRRVHKPLPPVDPVSRKAQIEREAAATE